MVVIKFGWARWVIDIRVTCDEQQVLYVSEKSLNSTLEANSSLYAN